MKTIGFIKQHDVYSFSKDINDFFREEENSQRELLINYLVKGELCVALMGGVDDFFDEEDDNFVGHYYLSTDGEWIWPEYIIAYLKKYPNFFLEEEFVEYVLGNKDSAIELDEKNLKMIESEFYKLADWNN